MVFSIVFKFCFKICSLEVPSNLKRTEIEWGTHQRMIHAADDIIFRTFIHTVRKNTGALLIVGKQVVW